MSLPTLTGTARILTDVKKSLTKTQQPMATALVKFVGRRKNDEGKWEDSGGVVASVIAFEDAARALAGFGRGDEVDVEGRVTELTVWNDEPRAKLTVTQCVAHVRERQRETAAA